MPIRTSWRHSAALAVILLLGSTPPTAWGLTPTETGKLRASEVVRGGDVAVDGAIAIVGAPDRGNGAAYLFAPSSSGVWRQVQKLEAADGADGDEFGYAVAIDGDTAVVGARDDVVRGTGSGSAYVFTRSNGQWVQQAKLLPDEEAKFADFGTAVAVHGDTVVIAAPSEGAPGVGGYAYVYHRTGSNWVKQAKLSPDNGSFGHIYSVAIDADTIVVGSPSSVASDGSAYVFARHARSWTQQARLQRPSPSNRTSFGYAVDISGDTIVVGAPNDRSLGDGSAYVFERTNGTWTRQYPKLYPPGGVRVARFGRSVAISGDSIAIGAPLDADQGPNSGAAYAFERAGGSWRRQGKMLASDGEPGNQFGSAVAVSGTTAVIGLHAANVPANRGSALVYSLISRSQLFSPGDLDADGTPDLATLSPTGDVVVADTGSRVLHQFSFSDLGDLLDAELIADINANGAPELAVLGRAIRSDAPDPLLTAEVRDLLTGELISSVSFTPGITAFDLEVLPDQSGNGVPELALLSRGGYNWGTNRSIKVQIADALGSDPVRWLTFTRFTRRPKDLAIYPDIDGGGSPEVVVMGDYRDPAQGDPFEIVDLATGHLLKQVGLGNGWTHLQQMPIADFSGNGAVEFAVLRTNTAGAVNVRIRDLATREQLRWIGFNQNLRPLLLRNAGDINGNGTDDVIVFGQRFESAGPPDLAAQAAQIKDSRTTATLANVYFSRNIVGHDLVTMPDVDGNGSDELVLLGRRKHDGRLVAVIKDIATRNRVEVVTF